MYDVVIIGAGPAGANLARLIGARYRVLLLDRRDLSGEDPHNPAVKCCGGLLAPDAQKLIAHLGLCLPKDILVDPQLFAVRTIDLTSGLERLYQRFYFNMDREKFDRWLVSLLPASVELACGAHFRGIRETAEGYEVSYTHKGQQKTALAKAAVGADGALSGLRAWLIGEATAPKAYIAIQERYEAASVLPYYTAVFDSAVTDFYGWIIPKDGSLLLGAALEPGAEAWKKYDALKTKLVERGFCFGEKLKTEGAFLYRPTRAAQLCAGKGGAALVGEAAGAISPSSAEGISYALKTSLYLAESLEEGLEGFLPRYERRLKKLRLNLLLKHIKAPAMYQPFLRRLAMGSGLNSIR